jgi:DNA-binding NarL/FixJ family response regulator
VDRLLRVGVHATDPLSRAGLFELLQSHPEFQLLRSVETMTPEVLVAALPRFTAESAGVLRRATESSDATVVLITDQLAERDLPTALRCGVAAVLPRAKATSERLARYVSTVADGGGIMPPHLVGGLLRYVDHLRQGGGGEFSPSLSAREVNVVRLMADGLDTDEIARALCYSQRTVKNVLYGLTHRLKLRNRPHAVAYAVRAGLI